MFPGFDGGMEWGGGAADPDGIYYVNINEMPWLVQMVETRRPDGSPLHRGERDYMILCGSCHGLDRKGNALAGFPGLVDVDKRKTREQLDQVTRDGAGRMPPFKHLPAAKRAAILDYVLDPASARDAQAASDRSPGYAFAGFRRWLDPEGYPAIKPPWGTLNAVDLNTGTIKWKVVLGEYDRNEANPVYYLYDARDDLLWYEFPSRKDSLGDRETISSATVAQMRQMQELFEAPDCAVSQLRDQVKTWLWAKGCLSAFAF